VPDRLTPTPLQPHALGTTRPGVLVVKLFALALLVGLAVSVTPSLAGQRSYVGIAVLWIVVGLIAGLYAGRRLVPGKYIAPGALLLLAFVVFPIVFLATLSFSNFGDGHRTSKADAVASIVAQSVQPLPDSKRYNLSVGTRGTLSDGPFVFFLVDPATGQIQRGDGTGVTDVPVADVTLKAARVSAATGYTILTPVQINAAKAIQTLAVPVEGGGIRALGVRQAFLGAPTLVYDAGKDTLTSAATKEVFRAGLVGGDSYFLKADGSRAFDQGWKEGVGLRNYVRVLTDPVIRTSFVGIFIWTIAFATLSVVTTFILGLALAVVFNDDRIRGRKIYRSLLLLPYAVPGFISLLVWRSFWNKDFGLINQLTGLSVDWFGDPNLARIAIIITNLWLGFPYMFVICTGALQAVPSDLREAASIDGASAFMAFRKVIFPILLVAVAPILVASFAFNFNNFNAIRLLTNGAPFSASNPDAGSTDILISYVFRLAFGGQGAQIGFAAAASVLLFVLTGLIAALQFTRTRALEDVN